MTTTARIRLWCDHDDCVLGQPFKLSATNVTDVRRAAGRNGWTHQDGKDYCPEHRKALAGPAVATPDAGSGTQP